MRGIPGSGKSTYAKAKAVQHLWGGGQSVAICSTDTFHLIDGQYVFQPERLGEFHLANQTLVASHMMADTELIIVDNTNVKKRDMKPYKNWAAEYNYEVEEIIIGEEFLLPPLEDACPHKLADYIHKCAARNTHKVPRHVIEKMARTFEE